MMTPTLKEFAKRLAVFRGTSLKLLYSKGPIPSVIIRAENELVGDLTIYDDGDELTIDIGRKHHTHVSAYNYDRHPETEYDRHPETERLKMVAQDAAAFVDDVMRDRVCVTVNFQGERCIGSSHFYLDEENASSSLVQEIAVAATSSGRRSERFLWSGPIT